MQCRCLGRILHYQIPKRIQQRPNNRLRLPHILFHPLASLSRCVRYHTRMAQKTSEELDRFTSLVDRVLAVPRAEFLRRQAEYKRQSEAKPIRPGPKRKKRPAQS
jgi:hypothetical protein